MSIVSIRLAVNAAVAAAARGAGISARAPSLERVLARADRQIEQESWRAAALRVLGLADLPATAALRQCLAGSVTEPWVMLATPLRLTATMSSVQLPGDGILDLDDGELQELAVTFNADFSGGGARLAVLPAGAAMSAQLLCMTESPMAAETRDPRDALGQDVWHFQPTGPCAARVRALMSEMELWLHSHALNVRRAARGATPVTGLWLWAGGASLPGAGNEVRARASRVFTGGGDPLLSAINPLAGWPGEPRAGVVLLDAMPGTPAWHRAESHWLVPAIDALRRGAIEELRLSSGAQCFSVRASRYRRFWRRTRPWWEYLEHD